MQSLRESALTRAQEQEEDEDDAFYTSFVGGNRTPTSTTQAFETPNAQRIRQEWRKHGTAKTQSFEEMRSRHENKQNAIIVRIIDAQIRYDPSEFTAYLIETRFQNQTVTTEHRYSDFHRLNQLVSKQTVNIGASFPAKSWAGRLGSWTPSKLAPEKYHDLVEYRRIQLDVWLVHLMNEYNENRLPDMLRRQIYEFLLMEPKAPCEQHNDLTSQNVWTWNNPLSFTLGSAIRQATKTVEHMVGRFDQSIPIDLLQHARGLCFMTVGKAGFVVSGSIGSGLVVARNNNGLWSAPCAVGTVGVGWGAQVGGDVTHYLIVLTTEKAVQDMVSSSSVQLGAELGVAVGPLGRGAHGHVQTGDWTLHPAYAYAHSQGFFVGMSLEGSVVKVRNDINARFYGKTIDARSLLSQLGPRAAEPLYQALHNALQTQVPDNAFRPSQIWNSRQPSYTG